MADQTRMATYSGSHAAVVTPHDTNDLSAATRGLCFATAGALKVIMTGGETVTFPSGALAAGIIHPLQVTRVFSTGTTAASIVAVW